MEALIKTIKEKKEFSALSEAFVKEKAEAYLNEHPREKAALEKNGYHERSKEFKAVVKGVRAGMREVYGVFQKESTEKRRRLLTAFIDAKGHGARLAALDRLLGSHQSTRERKHHYKELYARLFEERPARGVLDLGCGLNPLAYGWLPGSPTYECCDISEEDMALINEYFKGEGIEGRAWECDLLKPEAQAALSKTEADTVLMLKVVDTLESQRRDVTKGLIETLLGNTNVRRIIISFPQRSIGGRVFRKGNQENWFTRFLTEKEVSWERFELGDEEFYDVRREPAA